MMEEIWQRIEGWLRVHAPEIQKDLKPGATQDEIGRAAEKMGVEFSADFQASYRIHNGQVGDSQSLIEHWELYPLELIVSQWEDEKALFDDGGFQEADSAVRPHGPVRKEWWNPRWIPIAGNSSGDYYCLDLAPAEGGQVGQIITFWHADENREVLAPSWKALLEDYATKLEAGFYRIDERGWIVRENN